MGRRDSVFLLPNPLPAGRSPALEGPSRVRRNSHRSGVLIKPGVGLEPTTPSLPFLVAGLRVLAAVRDFRLLAQISQLMDAIHLRLFAGLVLPILLPT